MKEQQSTLHKTLSLFWALMVAFSFIFMASIMVSGQTISVPTSSGEGTSSAIQGVTFPVSELGNCANKNECKNYCNQARNMDACIAFAKGHGLMTEKDEARAQKFAGNVREGNSPGNCNSPQVCDTYCSNLSHLDECTAFAEKNGFKDEQYEHGKKIQTFLKKGGTTPGGCQSKEECQKYCNDFSHAKECFDFAQKAGIAQKGNDSMGNRHEPNTEQVKKIMELSQNGETPGSCTSKDECEKYCSDTNHREECLDFGVKMGFIKPEEATRVKEAGGKGPGGCNSQESCRAYCNDQSHHEECFAFAEEHGFITKEESAQTKEGLVRARQGFENAPLGVQECLKTTLGANIFDDIQSGKLVPGSDISSTMRGCFEKFGGNTHPQELFKNASPEVTICLKEKFGDTFGEVRSGKIEVTPEMAGTFRECFQNMRMNKQENKQEGREGSVSGEMRNEDNLRMAPEHGKTEGIKSPHSSQTIQDMLRFAPPGLVQCVKGQLTNRELMGVDVTQAPTPEMQKLIAKCFDPAYLKKSRPLNDGESVSPEKPDVQNSYPTEDGTSNTESNLRPEQSNLTNMPPEVLRCLQESLGADGFKKLQAAPASPEIVNIVKTCIEKTMQMRIEQNRTVEGASLPPPQPIIEPASTTESITFLEKFIATALMPLRWVLGK